MANTNVNGKSLESWIWDAACSIRGAKDASKYKDFILPLIFTKRSCDVFDDEVNRIAGEFYTPPEVGTIMSRVLELEPVIEIYDPCCGAGALLMKCEIVEELNTVELAARDTDEALWRIVKQLGFGT